jgi:hypothetical protein
MRLADIAQSHRAHQETAGERQEQAQTMSASVGHAGLYDKKCATRIPPHSAQLRVRSHLLL